MAKGQKRSNRELKKPKASKSPKETMPSAGEASLSRMGQTASGKKKR